MGIEFWLGVLGVVGIPLGIGVGIVMGATPSAGEFRFVRLCFWFSAIALLGAHQMVLWDKPYPLGWDELAKAALLGAFVTAALAYGLNWVNRKENPKSQLSLRDYITWDVLSDAKTATLKRAVEALPVKGLAFVNCGTDYCRPLAEQLASTFHQAQWDARLEDLPVPPARRGSAGIYFWTNTAISRTVHKALETAGIEVAIADKEQDEATPPVVRFSILAKPLPEKLPENIKQEIAQLGRRLIETSNQVATFAADRARELARSPQSDPSQEWRRRTDFSRETEALVMQRFGPRLSSHFAELSALGIVTPFWVRTEQVVITSRFLGAIGAFLERGEIREARASAQDNNFWFTQHGHF